MADPLTKLGISRRPAYELFGTPDTSRFGWSDATRQAVADEQLMMDEAMAVEDERAALEDRRIAREREREAENLADQFTRMRNPSAREKFFDQNEAALTGSRRYNQLAEIRQRAPSYSDQVLANNLASKIEDPDERNVFLGAVSQGLGTLAAREEADRFRLRRNADAQLAKLGMHPSERKRIIDEEGYDDSVINYYTSQKKPSSSDPKVSMLSKHVELLRDQVKREADSLTGEVNPDTLAKLKLLESALEREYEKVYSPQLQVPVTAPPPSRTPLPANSAEALQARPPLAAAGAQPPPSGATSIPTPTPEEDPLDLISSGELSDGEVAKIVDKVRASVTNPLPSETYDEWKERQKSVEGRIKSSQQRHLERSIVRKEVLPAWTAAKQKMADQVSQVSRQLGIPEQQIYNSLAKKEPITRSGRYERAQDQSSIYSPILGASEKKENDSLKKAYYTWDTQSYKGAPIRSLLKGLFGDFDVPSNAKVLEALAKERAQIPASAPSAQGVAPVKAPSGREIKIGKPERTP